MDYGYTLKKMLGCFNPILGQIWTNPNVGLKNAINKFNPNSWVCPYLTQNWVKTTQHFLECRVGNCDIVLIQNRFFDALNLGLDYKTDYF